MYILYTHFYVPYHCILHIFICTPLNYVQFVTIIYYLHATFSLKPTNVNLIVFPIFFVALVIKVNVLIHVAFIYYLIFNTYVLSGISIHQAPLESLFFITYKLLYHFLFSPKEFFVGINYSHLLFYYDLYEFLNDGKGYLRITVCSVRCNPKQGAL